MIIKILLIIVSIYLLYFMLPNPTYTNIKTNIEKFNPEDSKLKIYDELQKEHVYDGKKFTDDALFKDIIYFENIDIIDGETGLEKCFKSCKGVCVEFGVTGNAYCFPSDDTEIKQQYRNNIIKQIESEKNEK